MREAFEEFKSKFPNHKVGFSKFAELRPKHCVLAGVSGTHTVCVCTIHQNVKLMMNAIHLSSISTYHDCLARIVCNPSLPECYFGECSMCPGIEQLRGEILTELEEDDTQQIVYKQWVSTDRSNLETHCATIEDFVDVFCDKLELLRSHSFIATAQSRFYADCKESLKHGEFLVTADFSENYPFVLQDAAQGFHWNNAQATPHPFVAYYHNTKKVCHLSYVVITDCLHHDTAAVHLFQTMFIQFLKSYLPARLLPKKVIYFSDGAASQYKNRKNFINLCYHKHDFGIDAEWHFPATSHGKGACDGLGGTVKRLAARTSLQRPYNEQIMTPRQLFDWARTTITVAHFGYCTTAEYIEVQKKLESRFLSSRTIPGTRKLHSFIPILSESLRVRRYSASISYKEEKVSSAEEAAVQEQISGFVTCLCDGEWWLACVLEHNQDENRVKVTCLHPPGPSNSFKFPSYEDIRILPTNDILALVNPRTRSGRTYTLLKKELNKTSKLYNLHK